MSKFNKWLNGENDIFDQEIEVSESHEEIQSISEIANSSFKATLHERRMIVRKTSKSIFSVHLVLSIITFIAYISLLIICVSNLPKFSDSNCTWNYVCRYYIDNALVDTKSINVVTGMILDYRAFDTLGESFVLFTAVSCVFILLLGFKDNESHSHFELKMSNDPILKIIAIIIIPLVFVFGVYIVLNGHLSPGGGFSGGAILGAGLILFNLAFGDEISNRFFKLKTFKTISAIALFGYAFTKCYSFLMGGMHFYDPIAEWFHSLADGSILSGGYILILNMCVGAVVACTMYGFYSLFKKGEI